MTDLAIISGSGFYDFPGLEMGEDKIVKTRLGDASVKTGQFEGRKIAFLARHGKRHSILPNMINHRANLMALKVLETKAVVATTVCGVLDPNLSLARLAVFDDLYFPENRLPKGEICSIYDKEGDKSKGHYIFEKPFSEDLRQQFIAAADDLGRVAMDLLDSMYWPVQPGKTARVRRGMAGAKAVVNAR